MQEEDMPTMLVRDEPKINSIDLFMCRNIKWWNQALWIVVENITHSESTENVWGMQEEDKPPILIQDEPTNNFGRTFYV